MRTPWSGVLELEPAVRRPVVPASVYREMLETFNVDITDGQISFRGDTHFVFVVPEPAFEDVLLLAMLLERKVLSRKLAAAMLMVDFENAVFSRRRALAPALRAGDEAPPATQPRSMARS